MSRPFSPQRHSTAPFTRVNGKIRAREVRVIGADGQQTGVMQLNDALALSRQLGVDLVEISPNAVPPVCRLVDFGKFRYEQAKKEKESRKHQHASTVKEIQLSALIDPHDLGIKIMHAIEFLCEDMKVKVALRFRGYREMAHTEVGFEVINKFINDITPYGHPDFTPKLIGKTINLMISPLPRNKRAKNPHQHDEESAAEKNHREKPPVANHAQAAAATNSAPPQKGKVPVTEKPAAGGLNNPFADLQIQ